MKHEFNRHDEKNGLVERLDASFTHTADRWAERWQTATPFSREGLTLGCYIAASLLSLGYALLTREVLFLGVALLAYVGSVPSKLRGSLVEEIQLEATGLPTQTLRYLALLLLGLGVFGVASGLLELVFGALNNNLAFGGLTSVTGGLAFLFLKTADYIARTNPQDRDGDGARSIAPQRDPQTWQLAG